ncbi:MAG: hypothetical protein J2P19_14060 [Pseudonocardia sp.]|nr:hypothetical protein [Pseudonocardia sp.]
MTEPTSSPTNPADDPDMMAMRRRRDRYVASRLAGQAGSTLWDALIWVALAAGGHCG